MYKIYGLTAKGSEEIFYVGCTKQKDINKRKNNHIEKAKENKRTAKVYNLIRNHSYKINLIVLETFESDQKVAWIKEQEWIDKLKPEGNTQSAKGNPPEIGGWNKIELPQVTIEKLGTMSDRDLSIISNVSKTKIMRTRQKLGIKSYAEKTGNDGKIKKGHKGTEKGFYTKLKEEYFPLLGTMPDAKLAKIAKVETSIVARQRNLRKIKSFRETRGY